KKQKDEILKIIKKPEKDLEIIENELSEVRKEKNKILEEVAKKDHLLSTYISLVERKVCPTCNQRVDHEEFLSRVNNLRIELDEINRKKKEIELNIEKLELMKKEAEEYKLLSMRLSNIEESILILEERILKDEEELNNLLKRNEELKEELKIAKEAADNYRKKKIELEKISNEIKKLMEKRRDLENKKSKLIADMEKLQLSINNLDQEINKIKEKANKGKRLLEYTTWLEECFIPALEKIEVTIFRDANREFNEEFSRFFSFMVDDPSKSVMIDEEFTPIVMQESYEQDISNLSGGERTALALAFRLALNKIVQKRAGIEGGLLILDEPTDGLSKEQIGKIGDLIRELGLNQVIIVSHERELEGAVDHIFRVQKENGKSKVILTRG
ncbi:MAG: AAA family ATPase, partial [Candidatus Methanomethylicaceae archaeon]